MEVLQQLTDEVLDTAQRIDIIIGYDEELRTLCSSLLSLCCRRPHSLNPQSSGGCLSIALAPRISPFLCTWSVIVTEYKNVLKAHLKAIEDGFEVYGLTAHVPRYRTEDLYPEEVEVRPIYKALASD